MVGRVPDEFFFGGGAGRRHPMTLRATILGLLGALFIAGTGYINDRILHLNLMVGNHLPISVFGLLILGAMLVNPVLYLFHRSWRLRAGELVVIVAMMLVACSIPGSGLMRVFTQILVMPTHLAQSRAGWQKAEVLSYVPAVMTPVPVGSDREVTRKVVDDYVSGLGHRGAISLGDVPWAHWQRPLVTWVPLMLLLGLGVICLSLIVHPQWAFRERLRYPIADFARSITKLDPDRRTGPIFRNRLFWFGLLVVLSIRVINGIHVWYPQSIEIPLKLELTQVGQKWPGILSDSFPRADKMLTPTLYPCAMAFSFFLASDVGLGLGIAFPLYVAVGGILIKGGADIATDRFMGGLPDWCSFGAYLGMAVMVGYLGRRYYAQVFKQAFIFKRGEGVEPYAAWACRGLLLAMGGMIVILWRIGLDWPIAVLAVMMLMMVFLVMGRIIAETGLFFIQAGWQLMGIGLGLFGACALGPKAATILIILGTVFLIDPRESLMPFLINGLKMCDDQGVAPKRLGWALGLAFLAALTIALPVVLWANYNYGLSLDQWANIWTPERAFNPIEKIVTEVRSSGELDAAKGFTAWERITHMHPDPRFLAAAGTGLALVLGFSILRLRFTWWPLHPVVFLIWTTWVISQFGFSLLLGWIIKSIVTGIGGAEKYQQAKVVMIGVIAGDLLGGLIFMVHGALYYATWGLIPKIYTIFPW